MLQLPLDFGSISSLDPRQGSIYQVLRDFSIKILSFIIMGSFLLKKCIFVLFYFLGCSKFKSNCSAGDTSALELALFETVLSLICCFLTDNLKSTVLLL